jgi:hypothetical protein
MFSRERPFGQAEEPSPPIAARCILVSPTLGCGVAAGSRCVDLQCILALATETGTGLGLVHSHPEGRG